MLHALREVRCSIRTRVVLVAIAFGSAFVQPAHATDWTSGDVGSTGLTGSATEAGGVWTAQGAGGDIWGDADAFRFVYRNVRTDDFQVVVRVDDFQAANPFAKAGLVVRTSLDPGAATAIVDLKPSGEIEFMARASDGGAMQYLAGAFTTTPVWLRLSWVMPSSYSQMSVLAEYSADGLAWNTIGFGTTVNFAPNAQVLGGAAVSSHDTGQLATAHFQGLSALGTVDSTTDVGDTNLPGNGSVEHVPGDDVWTIEGAGSDIWGTADSFQFISFRPATTYYDSIQRVVSLDNTSPFAKAGLMFRDSLAADAMEVVVDAKPSGEVEFMARACTGCDTTYLGGGQITFPGYIVLARSDDGATFTAKFGQDEAYLTTIGTVQVPMSTNAFSGLAVTSHDPSQIAKAVFDRPAR